MVEESIQSCNDGLLLSLSHRCFQFTHTNINKCIPLLACNTDLHAILLTYLDFTELSDNTYVYYDTYVYLKLHLILRIMYCKVVQVESGRKVCKTESSLPTY